MVSRRHNPRAALLDAHRQIRRCDEEVRTVVRELESSLVAALGADAPGARAAAHAGGQALAGRVEYLRTLRRIRSLAQTLMPPASTVAVISKGDEELLKLGDLRGWHFPQTEDGTYAGHYPATGAAAVDHLEALRVQGAQFLLVPRTALWWFEHYPEFARHLDARHERVHADDACVVYRLRAPRPSAAYLQELQKNWHEYGKRDPLWAIKTADEKQGRGWDLEEFFQTGRVEIDKALEYVRSLGVAHGRARALDFGCGVGRLTQALCRHFEECCGVDIAPSMIELARRFNRYGEKCQYFLNDSDDLRLFDDDRFDFIYTNIVLQHIRPEYARRYVGECLRVLAPGGVLLFQLPSEPIARKGKARRGGMAHGPLPDDAFRAGIKVRHAPDSLRAAAQLTLSVRVRNLGAATWPARGDENGKYRVRLGNHWLGEGGIMLSRGDGRADLPRDLPPGKEAELKIVVHTPAEPGNYVLVFDAVQEGVAWFKDKGSEVARVRVRVEDERLPGERVSEPVVSNFEIPSMEMYGTPREVVLEWVARAGGTVLDVREDDQGWPVWYGFRYCVTKK